jgi:hypothetical protein
MQRIFLSLAGVVMLSSPMLVPIRSAVPATRELQTEAQQETETFFGTVLKNGPAFVLSDSGTRTKYTLDDSRKASRYEGMAVRVTGTLDTTKNLIHVETIQNIV